MAAELPWEQLRLTDIADLLPTLYQSEESSGWSSGMRRITHALLDRRASLPGPSLEIGCGAGAFLTELRGRYPDQAHVGIDLNALALPLAGAKGNLVAGADLQQLPFADASFALVVALDSFDQRGVDMLAGLRESWRVLRPQGLLVLRVSAHRWLEGAHDVAFNTGRRFARAELVEALQAVGFPTVATTYANALLSPAIVAVRLLQRWHLLPLREALYAAPDANRLLTHALRWEARWLQRHNFGFGVSLYAIACKPD